VKRCNVCGELKPLEDFYKAAGMRDGHRNDCKSCNLAARAAKYADNPAPYIARVKKWQQENAERLNAYHREYRKRPERKARERETYLLRKYGIKVEDYDRRLEEQGGVCAICKEARPEERTLHVDHDHVTGKIRGLLCFRCNNAIGDLRDDIELVFRMLDYLDRDLEAAALARNRVLALSR
jgi:hypothetical protein